MKFGVPEAEKCYVFTFAMIEFSQLKQLFFKMTAKPLPL